MLRLGLIGLVEGYEPRICGSVFGPWIIFGERNFPDLHTYDVARRPANGETMPLLDSVVSADDASLSARVPARVEGRPVRALVVLLSVDSMN